MHQDYFTDTPYTWGFYGDFGPLNLSYVARLCGLEPVDVTRPFRFLELGCGNGVSLNTFAACHPESEFVGVDLNPEHVSNATRLAREGELPNVPYPTTTLVRLTFQTTQAASQMAGDCQADVWWTANGNGLSPAGVVLANPQGSAIDIGNFTVCTDGIDNDGDGKFDFDGGLCGGLAVPTAPDPQCSIPGALAEAPSGCGGGYELALVILPIAGWRRRR